MVDESFKQGVTETLDILEYMDNSYKQKIPKKFMNFLEKNKSDTYISKIDHTKPFEETEIKEETKNILALLYLNYWANEEKSKQYRKLLNENERIYNEKMQEKYNLDNIFKKVKQEGEKQFEPKEEIFDKQENLEMIEYNKSFFKKIVNKIRKFLKI